MRAEIISVGDELLRGQRVNTNAVVIARMLSAIGVSVSHIVACSDDAADIIATCSAALGRAEVVLVTGGLGPTRDDRTKHAIQQLLGRGTVLDEASYRRIEERMVARGSAVTPLLREQAVVVEGSHVIINSRGTAAGMLLDCGEPFAHHHLILMPGVPVEMEAMMHEGVIPFLTSLSNSVICQTPLKIVGVGETAIAAMLVEIEDAMPPATTLAYLPHTAGVDLMVSSRGNSREAVEAEHQQVVDAIMERVGTLVYATRDISLEEVIGEMLLRQTFTVAVAESCTGGLLASRFTDISGASTYFQQGFVVYSNEAKERALGVPHETLVAHGAVSEEVAQAMALGCLEKSGADFALATTGIAGPTGGTPEKPLGTLCYAIAVKGGEVVVCRKVVMQGTREQRKVRFSTAVLREFWMLLKEREASEE